MRPTIYRILPLFSILRNTALILTVFWIFLDFLVILIYFLHDIIPVPGPQEHQKLQHSPFFTYWSWWVMSSFNIQANFYKFLQILTDFHRFPQISRNFWKSEIQIWISGNFPSLLCYDYLKLQWTEFWLLAPINILCSSCLREIEM